MGLFDIGRWFKDEANIFFLNNVNDGHGGFRKDWTQKYYRVPCRVFGQSGRVIIEEQGTKYSVEKKFLVDVDVDINKGDRVDVGGDRFIVLQSNKPSSTEPVYTTCLLGRMDAT